MKNLFVLILILLISSCAAKYEEVSKNTAFSYLLNTQYELIQEMYITGINLPPGYGKDINLYLISPISPTWEGPENITRDVLPKGTVYEIKGVKKCTNCLEEEISAIVTVSSYYKAAQVPVEISLKFIKPKYVKKIK